MLTGAIYETIIRYGNGVSSELKRQTKSVRVFSKLVIIMILFGLNNVYELRRHSHLVHRAYR